jgi:hypothetical protein
VEGTTLPDGGDFRRVSSTIVPAGNYVVTAAVGLVDKVNDENTVYCELRHGANFIGGQTTALAEGFLDSAQEPLDWASMTVTGGAAAAAGDEVSLWCRAEGRNAEPIVREGHLVILQVGGFQ